MNRTNKELFMKRLCLICLLFISAIVHGQTKFYTESTEFKGTDYTYLCEVRNGVFVTLKNKKCVFRGLQQISNVSKSEVEEKDVPFLKNDDTSHAQVLTVCDEVLGQFFTTEMDKKHNPLVLNLFISSETGRITDVYFCFATVQKCGGIPPEVYRDLELKLKEDVLFEPTEEGTKVNYIFRQTVFNQE